MHHLTNIQIQNFRKLFRRRASMLYYAVRDQLLTLSARHKYAPMMLPSVDFRPITPKS